MKILFMTIIALFFQISTLFAENIELKQVWQKSFGGDQADGAYGVSATSDGGFVVAGTTRSMGEGKTDAIILKLNKNALILWKKIFGKERKDSLEAITEVSNGFIVAAGTSKSYSKDGSYDIYVVKLDKDGKTIWQKTYGGSGKDYARAITATGEGVVIVGTTKSYGKGSYDFYVTKLDKNGDIVWTKTYGGEDLDAAYAVAHTSDGGFIIAGETLSYGAGNSDYYIVKIDANGKEEWTKTMGGKKADTLFDVKETIDGYVLVGESRSYKSKKRDLTVLKIDKNGKEIFHKLFGLKNHEYARGVEVTDKGDFLVAGVTKSMGRGRADFYILELDGKSGELNWANTFGGKKNDVARGIAKSKDGGYFVVGESESFNEDAYNFHMIKLAN